MNNLGVWLDESENEGRKAVFFIDSRGLEILGKDSSPAAMFCANIWPDPGVTWEEDFVGPLSLRFM
jgi:hypothetical protein